MATDSDVLYTPSVCTGTYRSRNESQMVGAACNELAGALSVPHHGWSLSTRGAPAMDMSQKLSPWWTPQAHTGHRRWV